MAASSAPPTATIVHNPHGRRNDLSDVRDSPSQRILLQPISMNGGIHAHTVQQQTNPLKPYSPYQSESITKNQLASNTDSASLRHALIESDSRPQSMPRRRSSVGLPTHLRLGSSGYGFWPAHKQKFDSGARQWITVTEAISTVILPLPYILASLAYDARSIRQQFEFQPVIHRFSGHTFEAFFNGYLKLVSHHPGASFAWMLASLTLLLIEVKSKMNSVSKSLDRRKTSSGHSHESMAKPRQFSVYSVRRLLYKLLCVGLPFYATTKVGADRVILILLTTISADIMSSENEKLPLKSLQRWKRLLIYRRWSLAALVLPILFDMLKFSSRFSLSDLGRGYLALSLSIFLLPPPFLSFKSKKPTSAYPFAPSITSNSRSPAMQKDNRTSVKPTLNANDSLTRALQDADFTSNAGFILIMLFLILLFSTTSAGAVLPIEVFFGFLAASAAAFSFQFVQTNSMRQNSSLGLLIGSVSSLLIMVIARRNSWTSIAFQVAFVGISFLAIRLDAYLSRNSTTSRLEPQSRRQSPYVNKHRSHSKGPSKISSFLLQVFHNWPLLHSILSEKDSRRILYFMSLNFAFMLVQTFYGITSGSLGLLSDSVHMFFDCLALVVGLCAAVMSKWPPNPQFPYGYGKVDTLAGFANGIFLMLISIEIVYEAIERLAEGAEMRRIGELLTVSSLGLIVNLVGITAFGHAHHGHSHGSHDHSEHENHCHSAHEHETSKPRVHDHDNDHHHHHHHHHSDGHEHDHLHDHSHAHPEPPSLSAAPISQPAPSRVHSSGHHQHHHHHGNENMHGIFLHILADTLGSVAVVVSTLLVHFYGWAGFDPLASCLIAILIFASAIPLVRSSAKTLLLTVPEDTEFDLREALAGVSGLRGVVGYSVPKFWLKEGSEKKVIGVIHVVAGKGADMEDVKARTVGFLQDKRMDVLVQVERDGSDRCWCRGTANA